MTSVIIEVAFWDLRHKLKVMENRTMKTEVRDGFDRNAILARESLYALDRVDITGLVVDSNFSSTATGDALGVAVKLTVLGWTDPVTIKVKELVEERIKELASLETALYRIEYSYVEYRNGRDIHRKESRHLTAKDAKRAEELLRMSGLLNNKREVKFESIAKLEDSDFVDKFYLSEEKVTKEMIEEKKEAEKRRIKEERLAQERKEAEEKEAKALERKKKREAKKLADS